VSYMIPFVAAGGLLIALGFLLAGHPVSTTAPGGSVSYAQSWVVGHSLTDLPTSDVPGLRGGLPGYLGALLFLLGNLAFGFLVPALAGYTAYAIADRPGLAPGFTVGVVATTVGAGFLGGLAGGLVAGLVARWLGGLRAPDFVRGLMPVVIVPVGATLVAGGLMALALGRPLARASSWLTGWLDGLSGSSWLLLGLLLGAMMAFDLGGPVNKVAYAFAATGLSGWITDPTVNTGPLVVMAAVMTAGMIPSLALALASTVLRPGLFTPAERRSGRAAWLLGLAFISEGAVPFAATDPRRVIPPLMLGSATAGAIVAGSGVELSAPHGGIFVFFAVDGWVAWAVGLTVGTVVGAVAVVVAKSIRRTPIGSGAAADVPTGLAHGARPGSAPAH
jgi:PTS system fructose-specific IIC component